MIGSGKKEGWPECFQDLGSWCPLPQDELHTPKLNIQDEFNFSIDDGHANDWDLLSSPGDLHCDPWGNDSQFGISTCQPVVVTGEINSSQLTEGTPLGVIRNYAPNLLGSGGKIIYTITPNNDISQTTAPPLKSNKKNVLLSQGIVKTASGDSTYLNMAAKNNNNNILEHQINNPVVIANEICVLPITVPDFGSAKLNSSSLTTSFLTTTSRQKLQQTTSTASTTVPPSSSPTPIQMSSTVNRESTAAAASYLGGGTLSQQTTLENIRIKEEEHNLEDSFKVPTATNDVAAFSDVVELVPPSPPKSAIISGTQRPQLKLNINTAAENASKFASSSSLSTPEVLKPLVDGDSKEFDLLRYVCNDGEYPGLSQEVEEDDDRNNVGDHAIRDHDYTADSWPFADLKSDIVIKSEPGSPASTSCSISNRSTSNKGGVRRKRRRDDDSSDYVASDTDVSISDDSQQDWSPTPAKRRAKRKSSNNSSSLKATSKSGGKRAAAGRRSSSSSSNLTTNQKPTSAGGQDKYRALRERNNEASRRSRMNRKQRDVEMLHMADELHKKNVTLKARAEKMENLVKYMRAEIMKAFTKRK